MTSEQVLAWAKRVEVKHISLMDASSTYNNFKLEERSSYLTALTCQFGRIRYKRLPFGAVPAGYVSTKNRQKI